jgi:cation:H+ antiporter
MLQIVIWTVLLGIALFILVRGAELFVDGAKEVGVALGMSHFAIGVIIVGFGTSLPELAASIAAVIHGTNEIVAASIIGSNVTNILFITGILAALGGRIVIQRDLIKSELPVFFIATMMFFLVVLDQWIDRMEALLLLGTFAAYLWYLFVEGRKQDSIELTEPGRHRRRVQVKSVVFIVLGMIAILVGAKYSVDMITNIATALKVPIDVISILAIAVGTSLPEVFVSFQALRVGNAELAVGNIFGSNTFNFLVVGGLSGILTPLKVGAVAMSVGIPVLIAASIILFVSGLAKRVMQWEGFMMLIFFVFFLIKVVQSI